MIRPMTGDFEFFDPIPLPAGNLGQHSGHGVSGSVALQQLRGG